MPHSASVQVVGSSRTQLREFQRPGDSYGTSPTSAYVDVVVVQKAIYLSSLMLVAVDYWKIRPIASTMRRFSLFSSNASIGSRGN